MNDVPAGPDPSSRVVVGVDGTPNSLAALRRAARQARDRGSCLDIVYVIPAGANAAAEASGYELLGMSVRHVAPRELDGRADLIVARGEPAEELVRLSAQAELLVIGARIHSEYGNLLGGDVVPYCLSRASCPVDICADQRAHAAQPVAPAHSSAARAARAARTLARSGTDAR
jgi:nucleotide-binding universal stress UspA family protein